MQAGENYYIEFFDNEGQYVPFKAGVRKSEMITVTLDANRTDDDSKSFSMFAGLTLDHAYNTDTDRDIYLSDDVYDTERGSLILTIHSDYLDTLDAGDHILSVHFDDIIDFDVAFAITGSGATPVLGTADAPNTGANFTTPDSYATTGSLIIIFSATIVACLLAYFSKKRVNTLKIKSLNI